jgi:hypothetical protein
LKKFDGGFGARPKAGAGERAAIKTISQFARIFVAAHGVLFPSQTRKDFACPFPLNLRFLQPDFACPLEQI